jgi:hypothetical protein
MIEELITQLKLQAIIEKMRYHEFNLAGDFELMFFHDGRLDMCKEIIEKLQKKLEVENVN